MGSRNSVRRVRTWRAEHDTVDAVVLYREARVRPVFGGRVPERQQPPVDGGRVLQAIRQIRGAGRVFEAQGLAVEYRLQERVPGVVRLFHEDGADAQLLEERRRTQYFGTLPIQYGWAGPGAEDVQCLCMSRFYVFALKHH